MWGCKTITEELPTGSTNNPNNPTVTVPFPVVVTPVQLPEPTSPTPTTQPPNGNPNPSPTATPDSGPPPVGGQSCKSAHETGNQRCPREGSSDFLGAVEASYDSLI